MKVYKNPAGNSDGEEISLAEPNIAVNSRNLLEITLPDAVATSEVYRLRLEAGAVNKEGMKAHKNKAIAPKDRDIVIKAAPTLDPDKAPWISGQKIIVTFDGPIRILESGRNQIPASTVQFRGRLHCGYKPDNEPKVISDNQLEIPLNALPAAGQIYRIDLEAGTLDGGKNKVSMGTIRSGDITIWLPDFTKVKPAFDSKTQLSIIFPVDVAIVGDGSTINVQKKDDKDDSETDGVDESSFRTVSSRDIEIDDENSAKINIILTDDEEITPYTQVWKVEFPANTVKTRTNSIPKFRAH